MLLSNSILCEGRVAVVSGGGRGLGAEYARELARRGRGLMISVGLLAATAPIRSRRNATVGAITAAGGRPVACTVDASTSESGGASVQTAVEHFGRSTSPSPTRG